MKRKIYLAVMAAAVISMAGCGKKITDTSAEVTPEPTRETTITEETTPEAEEPAQDTQKVSDPTKQVIYDHPELFWIDLSQQYDVHTQSYLGGFGSTTVSVPYRLKFCF